MIQTVPEVEECLLSYVETQIIFLCNYWLNFVQQGLNHKLQVLQ